MREIYPEKNKARHCLGNAIRDGRILTSSSCELCGSDMFVEAHHFDYSKPLSVVWLCRKHHKMVHRKFDGIALPQAMIDAAILRDPSNAKESAAAQ